MAVTAAAATSHPAQLRQKRLLCADPTAVKLFLAVMLHKRTTTADQCFY